MLSPSDVMPLSLLSARSREEIESAVNRATRPPKWKVFRDENGLPLGSIRSRAWFEWHWRRGIYPNAERERITREMRAAVIARDGMTCGLCGGEIPAGDLHIDHVRPVSRGGATVLGNLQPAHSRCNIAKGNRIGA